MKDGFLETFAILEKLDEELGFAFNEKFGFLNTKPNYLGVGLNFAISLEIPEDFCGIFQENLQLILPNLANIEVKSQENSKQKWQILLKKPCAINMSSIFPQIDSIIYNLFNGIPSKEQPALSKTKKGISFSDCLKYKGVFDEECYELFPQQIIDKMIVNPNKFRYFPYFSRKRRGKPPTSSSRTQITPVFPANPR